MGLAPGHIMMMTACYEANQVLYSTVFQHDDLIRSGYLVF